MGVSGNVLIDPRESADWPTTRLFEAIFDLRATRIYEDRPVDPDVLRKILRSATMACSSGNTQPWEFLFLTDRSRKERLQAALAQAYASVDETRAQTAEQLVDGVGRPITGHCKRSIASAMRAPSSSRG